MSAFLILHPLHLNKRYAGEPGAPQQHPWEVGAAFTTGFITYSQALLPPDADEGSPDPHTGTQAPQPQHGTAGDGTSSTARGGILQPMGGATMRRSTLLHAPRQVGQAAQDPVRQPLQQQQQQAVDRLRLMRRFMPYPQPYPLGAALLEAQMWLLGKLLSVVNTPTLLQVSDSTHHYCPEGVSVCSPMPE
jgi:hypothetical protein